jgi:hypothetical protein
MILVTGAAGFIGANFVLDWIAATAESVVNLDRLTDAGNLENLASLKDDPRHIFVRGDILFADNRKQFWIPLGFAYVFLVLNDYAEFLYKGRPTTGHLSTRAASAGMPRSLLSSGRWRGSSSYSARMRRVCHS